MERLDEILKEATLAIQSASNLKSLEDCRVKYLGKKSPLTAYLKSLGQLSLAERPLAGQKVNTIKTHIQDLLKQQIIIIKKRLSEKEIETTALDITLPGRQSGVGSIHPLTQTFESLKKIFSQMGFVFMDGPEIEDDYYNFTALNIPPLHPAREMQSTFYFNDQKLLRTHVSPVQIHAMKKMTLPLRMVTLGRVYRRDFDLTHTPMFHQMECLMIDEGVSFAHLKGMLQLFLQAFFSTEVAMRFRPTYFPFTEPSAEVDISCLNCKGKGCRICKQTGWLEVLGSGMVHPNVLYGVGIDSARYSGFAFGVGLDRLTLLKYGITDLRALFENDIRFLGQF